MWSDSDKHDAGDDEREFAALLQAHCNRELTPEARARLDLLAAAGPERWQAVDEVTLVHGLFDAERALFAAADAPVAAREEADPTFQRLLRSAALAEHQLRASAAPGSALPGSRRRWRWGRVAAAAAVLLVGAVAWWCLRQPSPPDLIPGAPGRDTLGGQRIVVVQPSLSLHAPAIAWFATAGAQSYDVELVGRVGGVDRVLFRQLSLPARVLTCDFPKDLLPELQQAADLRVRITARASDGVAVGSSGDLPVSLR